MRSEIEELKFSIFLAWDSKDSFRICWLPTNFWDLGVGRKIFQFLIPAWKNFCHSIVLRTISDENDHEIWYKSTIYYYKLIIRSECFRFFRVRIVVQSMCKIVHAILLLLTSCLNFTNSTIIPSISQFCWNWFCIIFQIQERLNFLFL